MFLEKVLFCSVPKTILPKWKFSKTFSGSGQRLWEVQKTQRAPPPHTHTPTAEIEFCGLVAASVLRSWIALVVIWSNQVRSVVRNLCLTNCVSCCCRGIFGVFDTVTKSYQLMLTTLAIGHPTCTLVVPIRRVRISRLTVNLVVSTIRVVNLNIVL